MSNTLLVENVPSPLILDLHGYFGTPETQFSLTGWSSLGQKEKIVVVWPKGIDDSPLSAGKFVQSSEFQTIFTQNSNFKSSIFADTVNLLSNGQFVHSYNSKYMVDYIFTGGLTLVYTGLWSIEILDFGLLNLP